ncbi:MAG: DNA polymerase III subunit beta [Verrucomicrobia bacterium]|nr:MAG: DNA polymerase III subunit beta [Verrucomicrobiota bacterium]
MKLKVSKEKILNSLQKVQSVVSSRTTLPILSNVLIKAEKDRIHLTATDLDVSVVANCEAQVVKSGATTLPARRIFSIFKELPGPDVEIEVDEKNQASIRSGASFFKLVGAAEDEFPPLPKLDAAKTYSLNQGTFREMLRNTSYATSRDESRPMLSGVLLSFKSDKLAVVATDGRRMALHEQEVEFPKGAEGDLILPFKTVEELTSTLQADGQLKILTTAKQIAFEFDDILIISKLVEGTFPNFRQVIPAQSEERISLEREVLLNALRRVSLVSGDNSISAKLAFTKNKLEITMSAPNVGEASETLATKYTGRAITIAFNPDFIMDPLRTLTSDEISLELTDDMNPGVIKCNVPFLYVIMPMRVS